ncbi:hypothetical protein C8035_v010513 [Colletotrichum spinosum]|uniref:DNA replication factor Cdt1 C-terminal domain-containing protein n=1 Tax=Colletotrichum spinosum TaxID=1347390 RepID=A0A4R8Q0S1_9PEZI|nr:hypothetical protein C8035_v010513 [Colletotrichum spinosum]
MARAAARRQVKPAAPPTMNTISKYARVSKTQSAPVDVAKKTFYIEIASSRSLKTTEVASETEDSSVKPLSAPVTTPSSRKRKARDADDDDESTARTSATVPESLKRQRISKHGWKDEPVPVKKELKPVAPIESIPKHTVPSVVDTHRRSRKTTAISQAKSDGRKANNNVARSKKHTERTVKEEEELAAAKQLPAELLELLDLQRAILKTVALQFSYQKQNAPLDLGAVLPHISRTWGKRRVTSDDVRRCIAIQDMKQAPNAAGGGDNEPALLNSPFIVADYGNGILCLELGAAKTTADVDENTLGAHFEQNLRMLCAERATDEMMDLDACFENLSFTEDLPKSEIAQRHVVNPLLGRGRGRALADLRAGEKQNKEPRRGKGTNPDGSKMSLLDRLRAKEAANAKLEVVSGPELDRRKALQRVGDVTAIISMLVAASSGGQQPVVSFQMPVLQQKIKDSLRVPMSQQEGVRVVRILATEVAPEWMKIATVAGKEHVVIQARRKPYDADITARVKRLSA